MFGIAQRLRKYDLYVRLRTEERACRRVGFCRCAGTVIDVVSTHPGETDVTHEHHLARVHSPCAPPADADVGGHAQRLVKSLAAVNPRADGIAVISHELRNSLGVVRNAARLLRAAGRRRWHRARPSAHRAARGPDERHIEHLLDPAALKRRKRGAAAVLRGSAQRSWQNAIDAIAPDCARRGHHLVVRLPADALWVHADAARLEQVFSNLLINAAKYTPDGGEIALTLERVEKHASVRIRDSGIGIAPAQLARIFEMFVQVDAATQACRGRMRHRPCRGSRTGGDAWRNRAGDQRRIGSRQRIRRVVAGALGATRRRIVGVQRALNCGS